LGVSQAVAFGLIAMVALSTAVTMAAIYEKSEQLYDDALNSFHTFQANSQQTDIKIAAGAILNGTFLELSVTNNGSTNLYDFRHFSLIVDYYANETGSDVQLLNQYVYTSSGAPPPMCWSSLSGIILPDELGKVEVALPSPAFGGSTITVIFDTNFGPGAVWRGTA
jgi:archaeal flagellar protein FlaF